MGRKFEVSAAVAEQILSTIINVSDKEGTTRLFNLGINYNTEELQDHLRTVYKSLEDKPERYKKYEEELDELLLEFCSLSKAELQKRGLQPQVALIPDKHMDGFNQEAEALKAEYEIAIGQWNKIQEENMEFKRETTIEVEFYVIPTQSKKGDQIVPDLKPREEHWLGYFFDYTNELGEDIPQRKEIKEIKSPEQLQEEAQEEETMKRKSNNDKEE